MSGTTITGSQSSGTRLVGTSANPVTVTDTATITSGGYALYATTGTEWTLTNAGVLYGGSSAGVLMPGGGFVTNQGGGTIGATGPSVDGIQLSGGIASTVLNLGLITGPGHGVFDSSAAYVYNQASGTTVGTITGLEGVYLQSGTVNNAGVINATANASGTYGIGIDLQADGFVINQSVQSNGTVIGGIITANHVGIDAPNQGTVVNNGQISGGYYGVSRASLVTNQSNGTIIGGKYGLNLVAATVVNQGSIAGTGIFGNGAGIVVTSGGYVTNTAGGTITGTQIGVHLSGAASTIWNAGRIAGGQDAVAFGAGATNRLVIYPGATFVGTVDGGNAPGAADAVSTLELASTSGSGVLQGLGGQYVDFEQITVDAGASWSLTGTNTIDAGVTLSGPGAITLAAGATLDVAGAVASGETVVFGGSNATLIVEGTASMAGAVAGLAAGDTIDLRGVSYTSVSWVNGTLDYTAPAGSASFPLALAQPGSVQATNDGANGTDLTTLCFCAGTRLATPRGDVFVERLAAGDTVLTASGAVRRIVWIGVGKVLAARGRRSAATPVIVRKSALAGNVPYHDLRVTKGHALWLDDVLIPVEFLVNHRSIVWDDRAQEVSLYHVELDRHDVLLANGAPAESYRDDGNRWLFANANSGWDLPALPPCAPVLTGGPVVDAVWRRLLERAGPRPGMPVTDDPDLHLWVDGVRVDAAWHRGPVHLFRLAARPCCVRVVSRSAVPQELGLARDPRPLGVALRRVAVRRGARLAILEPDDPRLTQGFHGFEPETGMRWTDGDAMLPAGLFESFSGLTEVELHLGGATWYPQDSLELVA